MNIASTAKKIPRLAPAVLWLLTWLTTASLAAGTATLAVSSAEAAPGETVTLTVSLSDNPGYAAFNMTVDFDETRLEMTDFKLSTVGGLSAASAATRTATYASLAESTADGALATLTFRVRDDAPGGTAGVGLTGVAFFNASEKRVSVTITAGGITVAGEEAPQAPTGTEKPADSTPTPTAASTAAPETASAASPVPTAIPGTAGTTTPKPTATEPPTPDTPATEPPAPDTPATEPPAPDGIESEGPAAAAAPGASATPAPTEPTAADAPTTPAPEPLAAEASSGGGHALVWVLGGCVLAAAILILLLRKRR